MIGIVCAVLVGGIILLVYILSKRYHSYWERRGVPQLDPLPFFGDFLSVITCQKSMSQLYEDLYFQTENKRYVGLYEMSTPTLLVKDVNLVENIMVKDFSYFVNRGLPESKVKSNVSKGLPQLNDSEWRGVRYKLIPAFSSGKLKLMYETMKLCSKRSLEYVDSSSSTDVDIKEVTTRYALDVIASCAFGVDLSNDMDSKSQFRTMGNQILNLSTFAYYAFIFVLMKPKIAANLGLSLTAGKVGEYFGNIIKDTMTMRAKSKTKRNDFIDLLLQLKEKGTIEVQSKDPEDSYLKMGFESSSENIEITDPILISQAFTFLPAGFDGLSTPIMCILYELAKNQDIQEKVRQDIEDQIQKYGDLTYEALKNAKYLDCCINEGLRLYPLSGFILRAASKDYELEPGVTIQAGTKIVISNSAMQKDANFYPDPLVFNPERFEGELTMTISDFSYLPFGAGPRICIGMRFAQLIMKLGLATIISNYRLKVSSKTPKNIEMKVKTFFVNQPKDIIYLDMKKIK